MQQVGVHKVRVSGSGDVSAEFELSDGDALTVEVGGREYVGVVMPDPDNTDAVQVVVWPDSDGDDNVTFTPPGVPVPGARASGDVTSIPDTPALGSAPTLAEALVSWWRQLTPEERGLTGVEFSTADADVPPPE